MSTVPLLTDEELIEEVMNAANGDDADDGEDDDDAMLNPVCPKVMIFGRHCKRCMTTCPSVLVVKIFNKSLMHSQF